MFLHSLVKVWFSSANSKLRLLPFLCIPSRTIGLIYSIVNSGQLNLNWQKNNESEWIHIGTGDSIKKEFLIQKVIEVFKEAKIYIVLGRENSKEINIDNIEQEIIPRIEKENFKICDKSFTKFIEFRNIGIIRIGKK